MACTDEKKNELVTVYRVAKKEDLYTGMYKSYASIDMFDLSTKHPPPDNDSKLRAFYRSYHLYGNPDDFIFGFNNKEQMSFWIHNDNVRRTLDYEGFVVHEILVNGTDGTDYKFGDTQAMFNKNNIVKTVSKTSVVEFLG